MVISHTIFQWILDSFDQYQRPQKPPSNRSLANSSKIVEVILKIHVLNRHIGSGIFYFEIHNQRSQKSPSNYS